MTGELRLTDIIYHQTVQFGELALCLSFKEGRRTNRKYLNLVPETDEGISREVFEKNGMMMNFELRSPDYTDEDEFIVYLGRREDVWDEEYVVRLDGEDQDDGSIKWVANNKDCERIKADYWCASKAVITLYDKQKNSVKLKNGGLFQTKIFLGDQQKFENLYQALRKDQTIHEQADITNFVEDIARRASDQADGDTNLERYYRIISVLPKLRELYRDILNDPVTRLNSQLTLVPTHELLNHHIPIHYANIKTHYAGGYSNVLGKIRPNQMVVQHAFEDRRNAENLYIFRSLKIVLFILKEVIEELEAYLLEAQQTIDTIAGGRIKDKGIKSRVKHNKSSKVLKDILVLFKKYYLSVRYFEGDDHVFGSELDSEIFYYDERYRELKKCMAILINVVGYVDTSEDAMPFEVAPLAKQYEQWCFRKVVEAMLALGFIAEGEIQTTRFYRYPVSNKVNCRLKHPDRATVVVDVYYERKFELKTRKNRELEVGWTVHSEDSGTDYAETIKRAKHAPDIVLEFKDEDRIDEPPVIVVFDPTLKMGSDHRKYEYKKSIRWFKDRDRRGKYLRVVKASWGIYPDVQNNNSDPMIDMDEEFSEGFIVLNPSEASKAALVHSLREIFEKHGLL